MYYSTIYIHTDQEPLLDITGSALRGKPNTRPPSTTTSSSSTSTTAAPSTLELSCVPIYFIRSIRMHLTTQWVVYFLSFSFASCWSHFSILWMIYDWNNWFDLKYVPHYYYCVCSLCMYVRMYTLSYYIDMCDYYRSRLVNESLLAELLVQGSLLEHFSALRSLLLLHDAHFARALTTNLFGKVCWLNLFLLHI